jgi:hypothetical protein
MVSKRTKYQKYLHNQLVRSHDIAVDSISNLGLALEDFKLIIAVLYLEKRDKDRDKVVQQTHVLECKR